jgi:hypothetical protein
MGTSSFKPLQISTPAWVVDVDQVHSSYLLLATLATLGLIAVVLFRIGLMSWSEKLD